MAENEIPFFGRVIATGATIASINPDTPTLLARFESRDGVPEGCEFGIFAQSHNVESARMLRSSTMHPHQLTDALLLRFEGVGTTDQRFFDVDSNGLVLFMDKGCEPPEPVYVGVRSQIDTRACP